MNFRTRWIVAEYTASPALYFVACITADRARSVLDFLIICIFHHNEIVKCELMDSNVYQKTKSLKLGRIAH